nr:PREDICTED: protein FAM110C [Equus przewalskii]
MEFWKYFLLRVLHSWPDPPPWQTRGFRVALVTVKTAVILGIICSKSAEPRSRHQLSRESQHPVLRFGQSRGRQCRSLEPIRVPAGFPAIARKPLRPDSLVIYRQKCEFVRAPGADSSRGGLVRKLFQGPGRDKTPVPPETSQGAEEGRARAEEAARTKPSPVEAPAARAPATPVGAPPGVPAGARGAGLPGLRRGALQRSQSDLSSRYSASRAESDTFFRYCGLDPEVVEALGRENFSAASDHVALKVRSVSVATSDSGFSRHSSGDEGLQEEELTEQVPSTTSVVERNARIIKWLYTCRKAKEASGQALQGPA